MGRFLRSAVRLLGYATAGGLAGYVGWRLPGHVLGLVLGGPAAVPEDGAWVGVVLGAYTGAVMSDPCAGES